MKIKKFNENIFDRKIRLNLNLDFSEEEIESVFLDFENYIEGTELPKKELLEILKDPSYFEFFLNCLINKENILGSLIHDYVIHTSATKYRAALTKTSEKYYQQYPEKKEARKFGL